MHDRRLERRSRPRTVRRERESSVETAFTLEPRLLLAADVLTYHNDAMRTGANLDETVLTPSDVNVADFGKIGGVKVDGAVYAQPLVKTGVQVPANGTINVLYIATENDSLYAFNADDLAPLWHDSFLDPAAGLTPVSSDGINFRDIYPGIGITSTPVIDPATGSIYVVAQDQRVSGKSVVHTQSLHALDLATGAEKLGGPVTIAATVPGRGVASVKGGVSFSARWQLQRSALLIDNGVVYVAWSSYGDVGPYHGWVMGYDAETLRQTGVVNLSPNGKQSSVWMGGGGPAADPTGSVYLATGNGTTDATKNPKDFGDSVVKLSPTLGMKVTDYFTPSNQAVLNTQDLDFGSGGVLLLPDQPGPHTHLLVMAGKEGTIDLLDRDDLGRYNKKADHVVQKLPGALTGSYSTPAYLNGTVYYVGSQTPSKIKPTRYDSLQAFPVVQGKLGTPTTSSILYGYAGATPSVSANGSADGVVWALDNHEALTGGAAVLRAYDASDVTRLLYDSTQDAARDSAGVAVTFAVPTVANGKVYVGGRGVVTVYGLLGE